MIITVLIAVLVFVLVTKLPNKPIVQKCFSTSCAHNKWGRCTKRQVIIYDNEITGICLWHTDSIAQRVSKAFVKGKNIGKVDGELAFLDKLKRAIENDKDLQAVKNPEEFAKWMRERGVDLW